MKRNIISYIALICAGLSVLAACNDIVDYNDNWEPDTSSYGPPVITRVTASTDTSQELTVGALDQIISVFGDNLAELVSVYINDVEVDLDLYTYQTRTKLNIQIPRILPGEVDNKLHITNRYGSAETNLEVTLPEFTVTGFYNEFAMDGDTVRVYGENFDLYNLTEEDAVVRLNGVEIPIFNTKRTYFEVAIPDGTPYDSELTIETPELSSPYKIPFREFGFTMLNDFNSGSGWWGSYGWQYTDTGLCPPTPWDYFILVYPEVYTGWIDLSGSRFWFESTDPDHVNILANPEDYDIKFELFTAEGISLPETAIRFGGGELEDGSGQYFWEWNTVQFNGGVSLSTNGSWKTITIPFTTVYPAMSNGYLGKTNLQLDTESFFRAALNSDVSESAYFGYWNVRAVKNIAARQ